MDARQNSINNITSKLAYLQSQINLANSLNLTDINIHAENFFRELYNNCFGYSFKNTNFDHQNTAHIDLIDDMSKVAMQITSQNDNDKISKSIKGFYGIEKYKDYTLIILLISKDAKDYRVDFTEGGKYKFDHTKQVKDMKRLLAEIDNLNFEEIEKIEFFLNEQIVVDRKPSESIKELLSIDLQVEWKREIDGYFETLRNFKPKTALNFLDNFLNKKDGKKPNKELLAFVHYQKGICHSFLNNKDEKLRSFITCYTLNPSPKEYKEQAILAYYENGDLESLRPILEDLRVEDPTNAIIYAIQFFKTDINEFQRLITDTPSFIKNHTIFQQLIFNHYYKIDTSLIIKYEKDLFPPFEEIEKKVEDLHIDIDTIQQAMFLVNWLFTLFVRSYNHMGFYSTMNDKSIDILKVLNILLDKIISAIKDSEVNYPIFSSMFFFTRYGVTKEKANLLDAIQNIKKIPIEGNSFYLFICANYLQIENYCDESLVIISKLENIKQSDSERFLTMALKSFIFLKLEDFEKSAEVSIQSFQLINKIKDTFLLGYLHVIITIYLLKKLDASLIDRLNNLEYQSVESQDLLINYTECLIATTTVNKESNISNWLIHFKDDYQVILYIGNLYFFTKQYDKATDLYSQIEKDIIKKHPRELSYYIQSLFSSTEEPNTALLLTYCKFFRNNYPVDEYLLRIEYSIEQKYLNWDGCLYLSRLGYSIFGTEEWLIQIIRSLDKFNNNEDELHYYLDEFLKLEDATVTYIPLIANILEYRYSIDKAVDLVIKYKEPQIRMLLLNLQLKYEQKSKIKDKFLKLEKVLEGVYVTYTIDGEKEQVLLIDTNSQNEGEKVFSLLLLNKNLNDEIPYDSKYGNQTKTIKIVCIEDKYVKAVRNIYQDANSPASGLPLEMFKFDEKDPVGSLLKIVGADSTERNEAEKELLRQYYNYELSILQVSITDLFNQFYLLAFNVLSRTIGIHTISINYSKKNIRKSTSYVLDLSSAHALYTISSQYDIELPTLYISKYLYELIKTQITLMEQNSMEFLSLTGGLPSYMQLETKIDSNEFHKYLKDILQWIETNCTITLPSKAVDLLHKTHLSKGNNEVEPEVYYLMNFLIPTISIIQETNGILITDDPIAYLSLHRSVLEETASSEFFLKEILKAENIINSYFIKNRYIDYTFSYKELIGLYKMKERSQNDLNTYQFIIDKIQLWNIDVCLDLILYIINTSNNQEDIEQIIKSLYKNRTKDNPINIYSHFKKRSLILNSYTSNRILYILYGIILENKYYKQDIIS